MSAAYWLLDPLDGMDGIPRNKTVNKSLGAAAHVREESLNSGGQNRSSRRTLSDQLSIVL